MNQGAGLGVPESSSLASAHYVTCSPMAKQKTPLDPVRTVSGPCGPCGERKRAVPPERPGDIAQSCPCH
jgi:hypothetical protein